MYDLNEAEMIAKINEAADACIDAILEIRQNNRAQAKELLACGLAALDPVLLTLEKEEA